MPLAAAALLAFWLNQPYGAFAGETFVDLPRGASGRQVARLLAGARVVRWPWLFLAARALHPRAVIQAGEYRFHQRASVLQVLGRLARGDVFYDELTVPEGSNVFDIAAALDRLDLIAPELFLEAARNSQLIRDLAPEAPSLEGYLFPATYRLTRTTTAAQLCRDMTARFRRAWTELGAPPDVHRIVTLASLVEKETRIPEERPLVAAVYLNRLARGMRLECDPTTVYAALLEDRYRGAVFRSDLASRHPYNTYQRGGLPPGPIANPGMASLRAVLAPARTGHLFFVARPDGSGAHTFTGALEAHRRAVAAYRRGNQKRNPPAPARGIPR